VRQVSARVVRQGQSIGGQLFADELVPRAIIVEGIDDVVRDRSTRRV
jgi:hypothetical protein